MLFNEGSTCIDQFLLLFVQVSGWMSVGTLINSQLSLPGYDLLSFHRWILLFQRETGRDSGNEQRKKEEERLASTVSLSL